MSLPELATPIRIYWDLTPLPPEPPDHGTIAAGIIALKILHLDLTATGPVIPPACFSILQSCLAASMAVTLTVSPAGLSGTAIENLSSAPPKELLLAAASLEELSTLIPLPAAVAGISFPVCAENWQKIPDIIRFCAEKGVQRLVFPMQRLYRGETPFHMPASGLTAIAASLSSFTSPPGLRITAHDPFLWRAIFPGTPFPNGRCQAANTMLAIDPQGIVYPCPVMPLPLGDLRSSTLKEIARGTAKRELREKLLRLPAACADCSLAETCQGGCRGRGERVSGTWQGIDPGCR